MAKTDRNSVVSLKNGGHLAGYKTTDASVVVAILPRRYEFLESESDQQEQHFQENSEPIYIS